MAVVVNLTPGTVAAADYPVVQTPHLGGQKQAKLTTKPTRLLGTAFATADGVLSYKFANLPEEDGGQPASPILALAIGGGIRADGAVTINYGGLSGIFTPVGWSSLPGLFDFPVGRAVEMTGTYVAPVASSVPTAAAAKQGSKFALIQVPLLADFVNVGCTNNSRVKLPTRMSKSIPCGMVANEWTTTGRSSIGELEITGLSHGPDDGLARFAGQKCTVMLETIQEDRVVAMREIISDWTCALEENNPDGDNESTLTARGEYSKLAILPAP